MNSEILEDIIINMFTNKYSQEEVIAALAWGEQNNDTYLPLMKKHQPKYYIDSDGGYPIMSCNIMIDLKENTYSDEHVRDIKAIANKFDIINKFIEEGKEIPPHLTKNFISFPLSDNEI